MALGGRGAWRRAGTARRSEPVSLAVLADASGDCATGYELCVLFLTDNDALLGSGDAVP